VVPRDPGNQTWRQELPGRRLINIEKHHASPPRESFICRHFDAFQHNPNAARLFKALDIPLWVVFGHGFDLCVDSAVKGILMSGYRVHLLTDLTAPSAKGYGPYGTEESRAAILAYLKKIGVTTGTLDAFLRRQQG
jgi:nicotinamidase-related amidase